MELLIVLAAFWAFAHRDNRQDPARPLPRPAPSSGEGRRKGAEAQPRVSEEDLAGELRFMRSSKVANAMRRSWRR